MILLCFLPLHDLPWKWQFSLSESCDKCDISALSWFWNCLKLTETDCLLRFWLAETRLIECMNFFEYSRFYKLLIIKMNNKETRRSDFVQFEPFSKPCTKCNKIIGYNGKEVCKVSVLAFQTGTTGPRSPRNRPNIFFLKTGFDPLSEVSLGPIFLSRLIVCSYAGMSISWEITLQHVPRRLKKETKIRTKS